MKTLIKSISKFFIAGVFLFTTLISIKSQIPKAFTYWQFKAGEIHTYPIVVDSIAYFGSMDKNFYAINIKNGKEIWKFQSERVITTHASLYNGVICFNASNILYGLDVKTGTKKWSFVDRSNTPRTPGSSDMHFSSPYIYKGVAYYGDEWGNLNGINVATGVRVFQYTIPSSGKNIRCMPIVKDDIVYFGDGGRTLYAISVKDSSVKWIHELVVPSESPKWDGIVVSDMVIRDTLLFCGRYCNALAPVSINTGKVAWVYTDGETYLPSTPAFYKEKIIIGGTIGSSKIHCINISNGKATWVIQSKGIHFTTPAIYKDSILIMNSTNPFNSDIYADGDGIGIMNFINCNTGKKISDIHLPNSTESSPIVFGDTLLIGKNDGLYAIQISPFLKSNDTSNLSVDNAEEIINVKKTEDISKYFYLENLRNFCDTISITVTIDGDASKSNLNLALRKDYNIKPGEKVSYGFHTSAGKLAPGTYKIEFTITSVKKTGTTTLKKMVTLIISDNVGINNASYMQNNPFPNPFYKEVNFPISLIGAGPSKLSIFSLDGRLVFLKYYSPEIMLIKWTGYDNSGNIVPTGVYFYKLISGDKEISGKIIK